MISTEDAFPSHIKEMEFAQRAWKEARADLGVDVQPHPDAFIVVSSSLLLRGIVAHTPKRLCGVALKCVVRSSPKYAYLSSTVTNFAPVNQSRLASTT
jgi:hypothetical protein